jgi:hypothetical protein
MLNMEIPFCNEKEDKISLACIVHCCRSGVDAVWYKTLKIIAAICGVGLIIFAFMKVA